MCNGAWVIPVYACAAVTERPPELDEVTLRRAKDRDQDAFRRLVQRYHRAVYQLLWRMLEGTAAAGQIEDLTQETFVSVYRGLGRFDPRGPAKLSSWILTIAARGALNELRRKRPRTGALSLADNLPAVDRSDALVERRELGAAIGRALQQLRPELRAAVLLREYHDLSYEALAAALDVDIGTVKSRLSRARSLQRKSLAELADA